MRLAGFPRSQHIDDPKTRRALEDLAHVLKPIVENPLGQVSLVTGVELPGVRGRVFDVSGPVLTLGRASDARKFKVGDVVHAATVPGGDGLDDLRSGSVTLTAVGSGTLTASADWASAIPGIAKGDYLCVERGGRVEYGERSTIDVEHGLSQCPNGPEGFYIVNPRDSIALVRRVFPPQTIPQAQLRAFNQRQARLASVYACTADVLFF